MDLIVVFALFVFMLPLLCFCVAAVFSVNKDLYKSKSRMHFLYFAYLVSAIYESRHMCVTEATERSSATIVANESHGLSARGQLELQGGPKQQIPQTHGHNSVKCQSLH